ncbi:DNA-dependent ATPase fun30 [Yamadazyma tenuis]|uniref:DNA helicase n=1 Tax=Candida tenuis (strain ATCC 10573 / BCRC 21748 / CBS 615 / JCM 9827 / NBRC 10315 / NRRL Y-1498 / VKM Y-70) TaxID=590646 RepID=G3BBX7_CANTC|nr:uncharacterized protein CANTEDRAFT_126988 [Yamadazyma tenuis ATCC 10573]XP_006689322.1 uncharacterized protein CANTEDRAFT_126988 [Yamadazyma tenuis ATCC 10573]EGV60107.1 hypothetical protein CANTEDRAFT_126988 [Yamadazyma tenuis ATCC 10573]EGV60108.1 hypothetical protein CANTEDRAFT_126988 [Yamadazyma tenuis ATCC 10573]WEJ94659.1 DNA-dependent ATPase fun30 [Yamadazyma tenuis]
MSWYKSGSNPKIQVESTPPKTVPYVQVPSSSPVTINTSPSKEAVDLPSINGHKVLDEATQKSLESRRQALRNHKDFPMVRKRFSYLPESAIFKGFVKGRGNLREITKFLTENYSKDEILRRQEKENTDKQKQEEWERIQKNSQKLMREYERSEMLEQEKQQTEPLVDDSNSNKRQHEYDEEESPIKLRGKSRPKVVESPVKSEEIQSTKVELTRPKLSILDKYKNRKQVSILDMMSQKKENPQKKKKLVRLSSLKDRATPATSTSPSPEPVSLKSFSFNDSGLSSFKKSMDGKVIKVSSPEVDELDVLEERIKNNRKNRKTKAFEEVLSDDDSSDDMSQEDEYADDSGLTSMDSRVLEFLNNASQQDITEIGNIPPTVSELVINMRPYDDIYAVSEEKFELPKDSDGQEEADDAKTKKKQRAKKKPVGQKLIESIEANLKGYRAVDSLVKKCSEFGDLISKQMEAWGVTVTGQDGELEIVDIQPTNEIIEISDDDEKPIQTVKHHKKSLAYIHQAPETFNDEFELKNYQLVGINWLNLLYTNHLSCILADEMGLGKTCQVIAFMSHLKSSNQSKGPHLVVVPSSTLENWLREFNKFCPDIIVQAYYGSQAEREELRYELRQAKFDVLVTTYNLASGSPIDFKFLRNQEFDMVVYDEGHMLKNSNSERYNKLMRMTAKFRLLLTGTPLQNNLKELVSLLAFMLPHLFSEKKEDLQIIFNQKAKTTDTNENYNPLLSIQAISKAKTMMTPFVLRRKKAQVLKHLPEKINKVEYCELTKEQQEIYDDHMNKGKANRVERERRKLLTGKEAEEAKRNPIPSSNNVLMSLRKAALHPLLFRTLFKQEDLKKMATLITNEPEYADANRAYILEDMEVMSDYELDNLCHKFPKTLGKYTLPKDAYLNSGKISILQKAIEDTIARGEKILVFSLFTQILDILERVLSFINVKFLRLDGQTNVENRQDLIDTFYEDKTIPVFLLSTRAGGFGINLVAANNVLIFDQSYNPHDDKQAEDRAHRVGQTKEVVVTRLIASNTIEENILQLAQNKLQLDQSISTETNDKVVEEKAASLFEKLLFGA